MATAAATTAQLQQQENLSSPLGCDAKSPWNVTVPVDLDPIYATMEILCAVLAIVGNLSIILLFIKKRSLRTVKNCYVISLASADLLVGLFGIPSAVTVSVGLPRNFRACLFMTTSLMLLCTGSIMSLVAVTVDRFCCIMNPMTYPVTMTFGRARAAIFLFWCLSTVVGLLPLFGWNSGPPPEPRCFFVEVMAPGYLVFIFFATIVAPFLFFTIIYSVIFREVQKQSHNLSEGLLSSSQRQQLLLQQQQLQSPQQRQPLTPDPTQGSRYLRRQLKVSTKTVKSIFIIVVVFFVSWFPLYTLNTIVYFWPTCDIPGWVFKAAIWLSHLNSVWNPIIYGWKMKDFRQAIRKKICGLPVNLDVSATSRETPRTW